MFGRARGELERAVLGGVLAVCWRDGVAGMEVGGDDAEGGKVGVEVHVVVVGGVYYRSGRGGVGWRGGRGAIGGGGGRVCGAGRGRGDGGAEGRGGRGGGLERGGRVGHRMVERKRASRRGGRNAAVKKARAGRG